MKRLFYIAATAMAVLSACTKEDPIVEVGTEPESVSMPVFKATIEGPATKTSLGNAGKVNWENGDEVLMMFGTKDDDASAAYIYEATPDVDASSATLERTQVFIDDPNADKFVMAIYPASLLDMNAGGYIFPATQTYNGEDISFAPMFSKSSFLDSETPNNIVFKNGAALLKITVPQTQMANLTSITVSSDLVMNGVSCFDEGGYMYIGARKSYPDVTSENSKITLNIPSGIAIPEGESKTFYIAILPMSEHTEEAQADHYRYLQIDVTDGITTKSMRTNNPSGIQVERNRIYPITFAENYSPVPAYEYVDLGLSVKWATFNVGATSPEEYGDYYTWGATETGGYSWLSYKYCNRSNDTFTKYCFDSSKGYNGFIDNKVILEAGDDVANVSWGGSWRMPTDSEMNELYTNCTWTWTTVNGVNGYKVQSNIAGYTDNWIFLPAAGVRRPSGNIAAGENGLYWSSSLHSDYTSAAYCIKFSSSFTYMDNNTRDEGYSVRPVYSDDPSTGVTGVSFDITSTTIEVGKSERVSATVSKNSGAVNNQVEWSSSNTSVATVDNKGKVTAVSEGTATITARTVFGGFTANCEVTVVAEIPVVYQYVDLGLSVKWATFNVGATRPEESGDYFTWGDTEPYYEAGYAQENPQAHWKSGKELGYKDDASYKHSNGTCNRYLTKYCNNSNYGQDGYTDSKTVLDMEDDAARANWGGAWRMPTKEEQEELINADNCTIEFTSINDVDGYRITSKKAGFEGNWIFLPAVGYRSGLGIDLPTYCYYWSSSLDSSSPNTAGTLVISGSSSVWSRSRTLMRNCGLPVRPVCE